MKDSGTCSCGGILILDKVEKHFAIGKNNELENFPMYVYECETCHNSYRVARASVDEVSLYDADPNFLNGVDSANGKI